MVVAVVVIVVNAKVATIFEHYDGLDSISQFFHGSYGNLFV